jgi:hypothetical protein
LDDTLFLHKNDDKVNQNKFVKWSVIFWALKSSKEVFVLQHCGA